MTTLELLQKTRAAMGSIAAAGAEKKNALLLAMADSLEAHCAEILAANAEDMAAARGRITDVMLDRLKLDENRITGMANGIRDTVRLPDHTGRVLSEVVRPNGIVIDKVQVPLGLVAIIYESRPNVTSDAAALAVKSGNVCMLRSGKEAYRSARAIVAALKAGVAQAGGDPDIVNIVEDTSHASAQELMTAKGLVDLLIPRGGAGLIRACVENATVPCIETGTGICHVYVDKAADLAKAVSIIVNAKASRPSVCNAEEVCLVHRDVAAQFLPLLKKAIVDDRAAAGLVPVELRLDPAAARIIDGTPAGERDFDTEFLDYILAVGVVDSVDAALFDAFDYVALGHLHSPQKVGRETLRYCGTPLKYSFSEAGQRKSATFVELGAKGEVHITTAPLTPRHELRGLRGSYMELTDRRCYEGTAVDDYLYITLTDEQDVPDALARLRVIYPNLMQLDYDNQRTRQQQEICAPERTESISPLEHLAAFYQLQNNQPLTAEQTAFCQELIEEIWKEGDTV